MDLVLPRRLLTNTDTTHSHETYPDQQYIREATNLLNLWLSNAEHIQYGLSQKHNANKLTIQACDFFWVPATRPHAVAVLDALIFRLGDTHCNGYIYYLYAYYLRRIRAPNPDKYWKKAADKLLKMEAAPTVYNALGDMFMYGVGFPVDYQKALIWSHRAADMDCPQACHRLGWIYFHGMGTPRRPDLGINWFTYAAKLDFSLAQTALGWVFLLGYQSESDPGPNMELARECFSKAARKGCPLAIYVLGWMSEMGIGCDINMEDAIQKYEAVSKKNFPIVYIKLGALYEEGKGVEQSRLKAMEYYDLALRLTPSHPELVDFLGRKLTPEAFEDIPCRYGGLFGLNLINLPIVFTAYFGWEYRLYGDDCQYPGFKFPTDSR